MKTLLDKVVKVEDIEIYFSILQLSTIKKINLIIEAFVIFPTGGTIHHKEPFTTCKKRNDIVDIFKEKEPIYVKQILEAKKDYDNRRAQRN